MYVCTSCGSTDAKPFHLVGDREVVATGTACDRCLMDVMAEIDELRRQFEELVNAGASYQEADRLLCQRVEGGAYVS